MIDLDPDAKLNRVCSRGIVSKRDMLQLRYESYVRSEMHRRLSAQLGACLLNDGALRITEGKYETSYEVDLYVLTSDQLEKYVQRRAERLGRYPTVRFAEDDTIQPT